MSDVPPEVAGTGVGDLAREAAVQVTAPVGGSETPEFRRRQAYITAVATDKLSASIKFPESTDAIPGVRFMHPSTIPAVGDTVWVDQNGPDTVISSVRGLPMGATILYDLLDPMPWGWLICDGRSTSGWPLNARRANTPDLRDKFVVGAGGAYSVAQTGGEATHVLSESEMPSHNHQGFHHTHTGPAHTHQQPAHSHAQVVTAGFSGGTGVRTDYESDFSGASSFPQGVNTGLAGADVSSSSGTGATSADGNAYVTGTKGSGTAHENRPPYYAMVFLMKAY